MPRSAAVAAPEADLETRERLVEVSARLFAERGFSKVTVREICQRAHANVAAVNYHFGGKDGLMTGDPLLHMIRNSMDHGIEAADKRVAGMTKSVTGDIDLTSPLYYWNLSTWTIAK